MSHPRMLPDGKMTIKAAPNIRSINKHTECWKQAWPFSRHEHRPGDVRRCDHGRIQVLTQVPITATVQGPGTDYWRDLSPIWDPIKYRKARKALAG